MMIDLDSMEKEFDARRKKHQQEALDRIIQNELTENQRQTFLAYHVQKKTIPQIAAEQGVCKSTACRTLRRAERTIGRFTQYI